MVLARTERVLALMESVALKGKFDIRLELFDKEVEKLQKEWSVKIEKIAPTKKGKSLYKLSWLEAYTNDGLTYQEERYMSSDVDEMPECNTVAKKLFLLAGRCSK